MLFVKRDSRFRWDDSKVEMMVFLCHYRWMMGLYEQVQGQMRDAFVHLADQYDVGLLEQLLYPDQVHTVYVPVAMDDGGTKTFVGFRSQHNNVRGPYKGGIRYHQDVSQDEVMSLSAWMSIKCSVVGIPLGGGKGGIVVDPKQLSVGELERLTRGYAAAITPFVGPGKDVPAPDVNTTPQIMAWFVDEYMKRAGQGKLGVITGKPLEVGGSKGRGSATATGGFFVLDRYLASKGDSLRGKQVAVQGAGNAGLIFAQLAVDAGAVVVAISDSRGAVYDAAGLDMAAIASLKSQKQSVTEYAGGEVISNAALLELGVDVLVPAALEGQITTANAGNIQAGVVLELANGPTSKEAVALLYAQGVVVIPDVLANAGGVTVSYFEQVQNDSNFYWSEEEIATRLKKIMEDATDDVLAMATDKSISLRDAAYVVSMDRILVAMQMRGM